jgi:peptide/nickel transport system permease protein
VLVYLVRRCLWMVPTLLGVSVVVFLLIQLAPGDPSAFQSEGLLTGEATVGGGLDQSLARFRERYLLDQPIWKQYLHYMGPFDLGPHGHAWFGGDGRDPWNGLLAGDLGTEFRRPTVRVADELLRRLGVTLPLTLCSVLLSYLIAIPIGIHAAVRRGTPLEVGSTLLLFVLYAIPTFWAGLMLQLLFGKTGLDWLPVIGLHDKDADRLAPGAWLLDYARHLVLPVACYTYASFAYLSRQMRTGMLETIQQDYVRTARAKGLGERAVVLRHALRNALIPVITLLSSILPLLIGGSVIIEVVFDIPGMGKYSYEALQLREYNVIMAATLFAALMTMIGILLSDIAYALVDPRIRYA